MPRLTAVMSCLALGSTLLAGCAGSTGEATPCPSARATDTAPHPVAATGLLRAASGGPTGLDVRVAVQALDGTTITAVATCQLFKVAVTLVGAGSGSTGGQVDQGRHPLHVSTGDGGNGRLVATDALQYFDRLPGKAGSFGMFMGWYVQLQTYAPGRYTMTGPAMWGSPAHDRKGQLSVSLDVG